MKNSCNSSFASEACIDEFNIHQSTLESRVFQTMWNTKTALWSDDGNMHREKAPEGSCSISMYCWVLSFSLVINELDQYWDVAFWFYRTGTMTEQLMLYSDPFHDILSIARYLVVAWWIVYIGLGKFNPGKAKHGFTQLFLESDCGYEGYQVHT
jgi:hypothetical protein